MKQNKAVGTFFKKWPIIIMATLLFVLLGSWVVLFSPSTGILSKFTSNIQITAQNAASNWIGDSDNLYRSKLPSYYVTKLDALTVAILRKGTSMSDNQFKSYLENLSKGILNLGSKPVYLADKDIQNILGFLAYEVNRTRSILDSNIVASEMIGELSKVIENTTPTPDTTPSVAPTPVVQNNTPAVSPANTIQLGGKSFEIVWYDPSKNTLQIDPIKNTVKLIDFGATLDFSDYANPTVQNGYKTTLATYDAHCRAKWTKYRLPRPHEIKFFSSEYKKILYSDAGNPSVGVESRYGNYYITRIRDSVENGQLDRGQYFIPNFIPKESLSGYIHTSIIYDSYGKSAPAISFQPSKGVSPGPYELFRLLIMPLQNYWTIVKEDWIYSEVTPSGVVRKVEDIGLQWIMPKIICAFDSD